MMIRLYPGDLFSDRFRIYQQLGEGGYGMVYHAYDLRQKREVALKISQRPLAREGKLLCVLASHTHVPHCYAYGPAAGKDYYFLSMQLIAGQTLGGIIATKTLHTSTIRDIVLQTATILATIHQQGNIVRDIKPGNLMVTPSGQVYLIDLGITCSQKQTLPVAEKQTGTPAYMAPEVTHHGKVTPMMDVYALGLVLRDLLSAQQHHRCARLSCTYCEQVRFLTSLSQKMLAHVQQRPSSEEVLTLLQRTFATPPTPPMFQIRHDVHAYRPFRCMTRQEAQQRYDTL